ncbi:amino acid permease [Polynucleobacter kasalickyi]|uniref:amino acid permease n=1 Tax=Polynucleobacter kasalickyi TaxID=1938817 RepID=UPI0009FD8FF0
MAENTSQHALKRHLKARHIRLMALGSTIGVGLFLGAGTAISQAGPAIIFGYLLAGLVAFVVLRALGEMAVHQPVEGSFAQYANDYVSPFVGYMVGWSYWFYWMIVGIAEVTAVGIYMGIWFPDLPQWIWAISALLMMGLLNFIAVRLFGEIEFWFALIKVVAIVVMIGVGLSVIVFGFTNGWVPIGFDNLWKHGGFFPTGLEGFLLSIQMAMFAYIGIEMIGLSAGETEAPEKTIPIAINSLIVRIVVFYVGALLVILAIYPWHEISHQGGSPFVAMFEKLGLREAAGIVNFVVITAALSSCNAGIFSGGRLLLSLSKNGYAPKFLQKISISGVPQTAVFMTVFLSAIGTLLNYYVPEKAFLYLTSALTFIGLTVWIAILYTQICFRRQLMAHEINTLSFKCVFWPFSSYLASFLIMVVIGIISYYEETRIGLYVAGTIFATLILFYYVLGFHKKSN